MSQRCGLRAAPARAARLGAVLLLLAAGCGERESTPPYVAPSAPAALVPEPTAPPEELPASFPEDVSVYPGAALREVEAPESAEIFASFSTSDSLDQVEAFYLERFAEGGWTLRNPKAQNPEERAIFADKGSRTATIIVFGSPESRRIDVYLLDMDEPEESAAADR